MRPDLPLECPLPGPRSPKIQRYQGRWRPRVRRREGMREVMRREG